MPDDTWWLDDSELNDEQTDVIGLPEDGSHLVVGPPGCGKTNILLLRAAYLARAQRPNLVVLVFTRALREFVARGAPYYQLEPEKIQTIQSWGIKLLLEHGIPVKDLPTDLQANRRELSKRITKLLTTRPHLNGSLECILVDEVQDCLPEEIDIFTKIARDVFFAGDDQQRIYAGEDVLKIVEKLPLTKHTLTHHYRNGRQVCKVADAIGKTSGNPPVLPTCNYVEGRNPSKVEFHTCTDQSDEHSRVIAKLTQELKAYPGELLGVACPLREDAERLRAALEKSPLSANVIKEKDFSSSDEERCIYVSTLHDVKGLEFRTMHLADMHEAKKLRETQKRVVFTATTRAKTLLSVYHITPVPGYLQQAREAISPQHKPPDPKSLFPGKKPS